MKHLSRPWQRPLARALLAAAAVIAAPLSTLAAESAPAPTATPIRAAISRAAATAPVRAAQTQSAPATTSDTPFLKSGRGLVVLAVLGAGVGYAIYSTSHDRITGSGR